MSLKSVWSWKDFVTKQTLMCFAGVVLHHEVFFHRLLMGKCFLTVWTLDIWIFLSLLAMCFFAMLGKQIGGFAHFTASSTLVHVLNTRVLGPTATSDERFVADQTFVSCVVDIRRITVMSTFVGVQGTRQTKPFFTCVTLIWFRPSVGPGVLRQRSLLCESCWAQGTSVRLLTCQGDFFIYYKTDCKTYVEYSTRPILKRFPNKKALQSNANHLFANLCIGYMIGVGGPIPWCNGTRPPPLWTYHRCHWK